MDMLEKDRADLMLRLTAKTSILARSLGAITAGNFSFDAGHTKVAPLKIVRATRLLRAQVFKPERSPSAHCISTKKALSRATAN